MSIAIPHGGNRLAAYHAQAVSGMATAESYYKNLATRFEAAMRQEETKVLNKIYEKQVIDYLNESAQGITSQEFEDSDKMNNLAKYIEEKAAAILGHEHNDPKMQAYEAAVTKKYAGRANANQDHLLRNYDKRTRQAFEDYYANSEYVKEELKDLYISFFNGNNGAAIEKGVKSMLRRYMILKLQSKINPEGNQPAALPVELLASQINLDGYKKYFLGYCREEIGTKAAIAAIKELKNQNWGAAQVGDTVGANGLSQIDIVVGRGIKDSNKANRLSQLLKQVQNFNVDVSMDLLENLHTFGIQSKSWLFPDAADVATTNKQFYDVGHNATLYNQLGLGKYVAGTTIADNENVWWHYNIKSVANNLIKALGAANVLYLSRGGTAANTFVYTYDLIAEFRKSNYFLSYWYSRSGNKLYYPGTTQLVWQQEFPANKRTEHILGSKQ